MPHSQSGFDGSLLLLIRSNKEPGKWAATLEFMASAADFPFLSWSFHLWVGWIMPTLLPSLSLKETYVPMP